MRIFSPFFGERMVCFLKATGTKGELVTKYGMKIVKDPFTGSQLVKCSLQEETFQKVEETSNF